MPTSEKPEETTSTPKESPEEQKHENQRHSEENRTIEFLALTVNGDGTNDAHRTSPFQTFFKCDVLVRFQRPRKLSSLNGLYYHMFNARSLTHARNTGPSRSNIYRTAVSHVCSGQTLHCTSVDTPEKILTLHPSAHSFAFVCIDVNLTSTATGVLIWKETCLDHVKQHAEWENGLTYMTQGHVRNILDPKNAKETTMVEARWNT